MNLPNKLTVLRMLMIPAFVAVFDSELPWHYLWALAIFILASLTDTLDGQIARRRGLVTDFGKFMDPLADKLLVMAALLCLMEAGVAPGWAVLIILARELAVTSLRAIAAGAGVVMAADKWGKLKTVTQMLWISMTLFILWLEADVYPSHQLGQAPYAAVKIGLAVVVIATVGSGGNYLWKNRSLFADR